MRVSLVMKTTNGESRPFLLTKRRSIIGNEPKCDVRIAIPAVAGRHCEVVNTDSEVRVADLGSSDGTIVNGERIESAALAHGDTLCIGPVVFDVVVEAHAEPTEVKAPTIDVVTQPLIDPIAGSNERV